MEIINLDDLVATENAWHQQGKLDDRYQIYLANTDEDYPKTYVEWLGI